MNIKIIFVFVAYIFFNLSKSYGNAVSRNETRTNITDSITISDYQTKTVHSVDLAKVQLNEVEERSKLIHDENFVGENSNATIKNSNKTLSRKITPTNDQILDTVTLNSSKNVTVLRPVSKTLASNGTDTSTTGNKTRLEIVATTTVSHLSTELNETITTPRPKLNATTVSMVRTSVSTSNGTISTTTKLNVPPITTTPSTTSTTSNATTAKVRTSTTPKPKKPLRTYGIEDYPELDAKLLASKSNIPAIKNPMPETAPIRELPKAQPSQEMPSSLTSGSNFVPILTVIFTVPLILGIFFTSYRRFKEFWSTRHYRRMDFLVDGMYND